MVCIKKEDEFSAHANGCPRSGPKKYREQGNGVPRKADSWQEGRSLYHEEPGRKVVFYALDGETSHLWFYLHPKQLSLI